LSLLEDGKRTQRKILTPEQAIAIVKHKKTRQSLIEYLDLLKKRLKMEEVKGDSCEYSYYSRGQAHDRHNPSWKPFGILERCCKKARLSLLAVKEMIEEQIGRKIVCECEIFSDPKEVKRKRLQSAFEVGFGKPGKRNLEVVWDLFEAGPIGFQIGPA
jgi:hypothetical protein